jgi:hypothetical protein
VTGPAKAAVVDASKKAGRKKAQVCGAGHWRSFEHAIVVPVQVPAWAARFEPITPAELDVPVTVVMPAPLTPP